MTYGTSLETGLYEVLGTTELIDAEYKTCTAGPELPSKLWSHCAVSIDQNLAMIVGGCKEDSMWTSLPSTFTKLGNKLEKETFKA